MKICTKCSFEKEDECFSPKNDGTGRKHARCKNCRNEDAKKAYLKDGYKRKKQHQNYLCRRAYGISLEDKEKIFSSQGRKCACCGNSEPGSKKGWHIDHDHSTKTIRGVLCHPCNVTLGCSKEDIKRLRSLVDYIRLHTDAKIAS